MSKLFFVKHPVHEPGYGAANTGDRVINLWTTTTHTRKFIKHDGVFLSNGKIDYARLYFWGEYEPFSSALIVQQKFPQAVHEDLKSMRPIFSYCHPYYPVSPIPHNGLNSDPYVFGERFRYTCCQKSQTLSSGDIVVFGNEDHGLFYFDTVFVCKKDGVDISTREGEGSQYDIVALKPIAKRTFAEGYMYYDHYNNEFNQEVYSFVPCLPHDRKNNDIYFAQSFQKPYLNLSALGINHNNPRKIMPIELQKEHWPAIINAVNNANLCIGIQLANI